MPAQFLMFAHEHNDPDAGGLNALHAACESLEDAHQQALVFIEEEEVDEHGQGFSDYMYIEVLDTAKMECYRWCYEQQDWTGPYELGLG